MFRVSREAQQSMAKAHAARTLAQDLRPLAAKVACYEERGRVAVFGAGGQCAHLVLNDDSKLEQAITPLGRTTRFAYREDKLASVTSPTGLVTSFEYHAHGLLAAIRNTYGRQAFRYDDAGRLIEYRAGSRVFSLTWDADHQLVAFRDGCGQQTNRRYDWAGGLVEIQDTRRVCTRMAYGQWPQPDHVLHPDLTEESFCWRFGSFSQDIDGNRHADVELDEAGRLTLVEYADGHSISFSYGHHGIVEGTSPDAKVSFSYDEKGRVVSETTEERAVRFEYTEVRFDYDPDGRVGSVRDWNGGVQTFGYQNHEQPLLRRLPSGLLEAYERHQAGQLKATGVAREDGRWLWYERYERDGDQRVSRCHDTRHGARDIRYDGEGRVLSASRADLAHDEWYAYDPSGNRTRSGGVDIHVDIRNRPIRAGDAQYSYCPRGNRVKDISPRGSVRYTYNGQNLLTKVETGEGLIEYAYDAFARRTRKHHGDANTTYVWAGHHLVQEIHDSVEGRTTREYVYWPGTHTPLAMRCAGAVYFYHCDHLGTPQLMTDGAGRIVWSAKYDAFGRVQIEIEEIENRCAFQASITIARPACTTTARATTTLRSAAI